MADWHDGKLNFKPQKCVTESRIWMMAFVHPSAQDCNQYVSNLNAWWIPTKCGWARLFSSPHELSMNFWYVSVIWSNCATFSEADGSNIHFVRWSDRRHRIKVFRHFTKADIASVFSSFR
jgi:hypothetical protein